MATRRGLLLYQVCIVIKNQTGDWGLLRGHWIGYKKGSPAVPGMYCNQKPDWGLGPSNGDTGLATRRGLLLFQLCIVIKNQTGDRGLLRGHWIGYKKGSPAVPGMYCNQKPDWG